MESKDSCDVSKLLAFHWFEEKPSKSAIMCGLSIAFDACDTASSRVLLPMWTNSLSICIEMNVTDDRTDISLDLTTVRASHRAALMDHGHTLS